jgi:hypothetical protein
LAVQTVRDLATPRLGILVAVFALARSRERFRGLLLVALAVSLLSSVFYLSYVNTVGGSLFFGVAHYFKSWFALWALVAGYGAVYLARFLPRTAHRS